MMHDRPTLKAEEEDTPSIGHSLIAREGWVVMHLFYHLEYATWDLLGGDIQRKAKTELTQLVQEIRAQGETQLLTFGMVSPKADLGFMLLTPDLHTAHAFEKQLSLSLLLLSSSSIMYNSCERPLMSSRISTVRPSSSLL